MQFLKEIKYRKVNFLLSVIGVMAAVALMVVFITMTRASQNETRRLTRDMGFNLRIVPEETDMNQFWIAGYSERTMPQKYVQKLVDAKAIYYAHLTATLHKRIVWNDIEVMLTGISPDELEVGQKKKSKMIFAIAPEKVYVGYEIANKFKIKTGDKIDILGQSFEVERTLTEAGSDDDIRFYFDLKKLQSLVDMEGRINEIMALNCMCSTKGDDPLAALREQMEQILPDTKVIMNKSIAVSRERQRKMVDSYFELILPVVLLICALWIAGMAMLNAMQRRHEVGILRAIGYSTFKVALLFFQRAALAGVIGACLGFVIGNWFSLSYGPDIFKVTVKSIKADYILLGWSLLLAPLFAIIASFIPVMNTISQQPAQILKED